MAALLLLKKCFEFIAKIIDWIYSFFGFSAKVLSK